MTILPRRLRRLIIACPELGAHGAMVNGVATFFPLGGGGASATADAIPAMRARLTRSG